MDKLLTVLCESLRNGQNIVLATIIMQTGSTPRTAGTRMLVRGDGTPTGTIGGGLVEAKTIEVAKDLLASGGAKILDFDLTSREIAQSVDMICGGRLDVLVERVEASQNNISLFRDLSENLRNGSDCLLVTEIPAKNKSEAVVHRCLISRDGVAINNCRMKAAQLEAIMREVGRGSQATLLSYGEAQFLVEPFLVPSTLYLFGAGHVSQHTASIASLVGFRTVVLDDRAEFANAGRFPQADEISVLPSFENPMDGLSINQQSYLVIVTRGHSHDKTVLGHALKTQAGYIGMIGSRRKRDSIYALLRKEGFGPADLNRVHCPIGLSIGGETPEEIAVSIVAELIEARARLQRQREAAK